MTREQSAARLAAGRALDMDTTLGTLHPDCVFVDEPLARGVAATVAVARGGVTVT